MSAAPVKQLPRGCTCRRNRPADSKQRKRQRRRKRAAVLSPLKMMNFLRLLQLMPLLLREKALRCAWAAAPPLLTQHIAL